MNFAIYTIISHQRGYYYRLCVVDISKVALIESHHVHFNANPLHLFTVT